MPEDIEEVEGSPATATAEAESSYSDILAGQAEAPIKPEAGAKADEEINPEVGKELPTTDEIVLEIGGKEYPVKQADLLEYLANQSKFADREKSLSEKEKSLNRDYTQKSQQVAEFRKSFEGAFGRLPQTDEIQALGKVWKAYFQNPQAKQAVDAIITGRFDAISKGAGAKPQDGENPYQSLFDQQAQKIAELEERLGGFTQSITEREENERMGNAQKTWQGWADSKSKAGIKITDEIDTAMAPFITALKAKHPDWDANKILDTAYRHATIDDIEKTVAGNVLKSADKAKSGTIPRIKPKGSAKPDSEKTYRDLMMEASS